MSSRSHCLLSHHLLQHMVWLVIAIASVHCHQALHQLEHRAIATVAEASAVRLEARADGNPQLQAETYTAVCAFGASYADDGRIREQKYAESRRKTVPYDRFGGRCTNGPVAVEYMVDPNTRPSLISQGSNPPALLNHAYTASVISERLTPSGKRTAADMENQINEYISTADAKLCSGRIVYVVDHGVNTVVWLWTGVIASKFDPKIIANQHDAIKINLQAYESYIRLLNTDPTLASKCKNADYIIVLLPPLQKIPSFRYLMPSDWTDDQKSQGLSALEDLTTQFNNELRAFASSFKTQVRAGGKVAVYDLSDLFNRILASPGSFGVTVSPVEARCWEFGTPNVCSDPQHYLYFDTLHPVTSIHAIWAKEMNEALLKERPYSPNDGASPVDPGTPNTGSMIPNGAAPNTNSPKVGPSGSPVANNSTGPETQSNNSHTGSVSTNTNSTTNAALPSGAPLSREFSLLVLVFMTSFAAIATFQSSGLP